MESYESITGEFGFGAKRNPRATLGRVTVSTQLFRGTDWLTAAAAGRPTRLTQAARVVPLTKFAPSAW